MLNVWRQVPHLHITELAFASDCALEGVGVGVGGDSEPAGSSFIWLGAMVLSGATSMVVVVVVGVVTVNVGVGMRVGVGAEVNVWVEVKVDAAAVDVKTGSAMEGAETESKVGERELAEGAGVTVSKGGVKTGPTGLLGELDRDWASKVSGERDGITGEVEA